jgi:hypothetical protein
VDQLGGQLLAGQAGVLAIGGLDGRLGRLVGATNAAVAKPGGQAPDAEAAEGGKTSPA